MGMQVKTALRVELCPIDHVSVLREDVVDLSVVKVGDVVKVLPGAKVPTDGVVVRGSSYMDESMLSGECIPVSKQKGDLVYGEEDEPLP
jgi:Cu+-exporting ATPase